MVRAHPCGVEVLRRRGGLAQRAPGTLHPGFVGRPIAATGEGLVSWP